MKRMRFVWVLMSLFLLINMAHAVEYVSVSDRSAILYNANSIKAKKLYVVSRYTPLEKVVNLQDWIKVRDRSGTMAWVEKRAVSDKRFVVVNVPTAIMRDAPQEKSKVLFQVSSNVALELMGVNAGGWIKARHQDGGVGYMKSIEVWGAE